MVAKPNWTEYSKNKGRKQVGEMLFFFCCVFDLISLVPKGDIPNFIPALLHKIIEKNSCNFKTEQKVKPMIISNTFVTRIQ